MSKPKHHPLAIWRWKLHWQILLGLVIGAVLGYATGQAAINGLSPEVASSDEAGAAAATMVEGRWDYMIYDLLGDLFLNGLKLIIVPLVTTSIILAIASIGSQKGFGRLGGKTLLYYGCTSLIAIVIGLAIVNLVKPGVNADGLGILEGKNIDAFAGEQAQITEKVGGKQGSDFLNVFREMVPPNIIDAAAQGKLLGLIVVSMLIGYFMTRIDHAMCDTLKRLVEAVYAVTMKVTDLVLRLAPIGVAALIAGTVAVQHAKLSPDARFNEFITGIGLFAIITLVALGLHFAGTMPLILALIARANPLRHYKAMAPALVTAFSTGSSSATLPVTMECVEDRAGVSNKTAGFVLPLGATVNMDGTALYECVAAVFICQAFGVELTIAQQFFIVMTALLTSVGVAGVPAASLVAIVIILQSVENQLAAQGVIVPLVSGMALLFVFDRPLDMCRTAVNVFSDSVGAVTIAATEGEAVLTDAVDSEETTEGAGTQRHGENQ